MTHTMERLEQNQNMETAEWEPRINARGHLALVDWGGTADPSAPAAPGKQSPAPARAFDPLVRSRAEKIIERGMALWMASIVFAVLACMAHL